MPTYYKKSDGGDYERINYEDILSKCGLKEEHLRGMGYFPSDQPAFRQMIDSLQSTIDNSENLVRNNIKKADPGINPEYLQNARRGMFVLSDDLNKLSSVYKKAEKMLNDMKPIIVPSPGELMVDIDELSKRYPDSKYVNRINAVLEDENYQGDEKVRACLREVLLVYRELLRSVKGRMFEGALANDLRGFCKNQFNIELPSKLGKGELLSADTFNKTELYQCLFKDELARHNKSLK